MTSSTEALWERLATSIRRSSGRNPTKQEALVDLATLREQFEALALRADGLTQIGHGLVLDEPVNAGSLAWATAAFKFLETLATDTKGTP